MAAAMKNRTPPLSSGPGIFEAFLTLVAVVALDFTLSQWLPAGGSAWSAASLYRVAAARSIEIAVLYAWWHVRGFPLGDFGLSAPQAVRGVSIGVLLSFALGGVAFAAEALFQRMGWGSFFRLVSGPRVGDAFGALVLAAVVVAPLFEELVFRGLVYGALRRRWGVVPSLVVSVAVFALAHLPGGGNIPWVQAVGGVVFCLGLEATGSLWVPLVIHSIGNLVLFSIPRWM
jgi:membrane protease YdiL (CAAX protease family)